MGALLLRFSRILQDHSPLFDISLLPSCTFDELSKEWIDGRSFGLQAMVSRLAAVG